MNAESPGSRRAAWPGLSSVVRDSVRGAARRPGRSQSRTQTPATDEGTVENSVHPALLRRSAGRNGAGGERRDPSTQTARYTDTAGQVVEMGKHGTNQTSPTTSMSGGGDGSNPQPQTADDSTPDYSSD
uniref:ATP-grasp-modified RiPP n=1 Tax=Streptomyces tenjimariensis TaxID=29308 RepID=Q2UZB1_9ACTN|nr:hypothetical protein [Streptomyces tenjimariensis]